MIEFQLTGQLVLEDCDTMGEARERIQELSGDELRAVLNFEKV